MKETDLTHVKPGQKATVVLDIYPGCHLERRGRKHQPGDRRRVRDPAAAERLGQLGQGRAAPAGAGPVVAAPGEPPLRAGMTATVTIDIGRQRSLADLLGGSASAARPE